MQPIRWTCAFLAFGVASEQAQDRTGGGVEKVIALENVWNQAEQRKDTKALDSILDNSLIYVDYDGSLRTKAEFLAQVRGAGLLPEGEITKDVTAHAVGSAVVVTGVYVMTGSENGKPYNRRGRFVDLWMNKDGAWVCITAQATPILK